MKILIIEDDRVIADYLELLLRDKGFYVTIAGDGEEGLDQALRGIYDLLIVDVMVPKIDGYEVTLRLRQKNYHIPIILLSEKCGEEERIRGLTVGSDYHLPRVFNTEELLSSVKLLLRRREKMTDTLTMGNTTLDLLTGIMVCGRRSVRLPPKEFMIMRILMRSKDTVVSKERILAQVWKDDSGTEESYVEAYVFLLRKKLSSIHSDIKIMTFRGLGYCLEVREECLV
ncbi:MAG: response regulator transcription factor [Clostridiales bacterium]|nr:response regulator transcription factor [Clostridiales bacterium]